MKSIDIVIKHRYVKRHFTNTIQKRFTIVTILLVAHMQVQHMETNLWRLIVWMKKSHTFHFIRVVHTQIHLYICMTHPRIVFLSAA